jgi:putative endonuclease
MGPFRYIVKRFSPALNSPSRLVKKGGVPFTKDDVGSLGEDLAARFLWASGCKVLYRNYRAPRGGELDIVCRERDTLLFLEVKTRTSDKFGRPIDAVTMDKRYLITRGAMAWLRLLDYPDVKFRFDVVELILADGEVPQFNWVKDAFHLPEPYRY